MLPFSSKAGHVTGPLEALFTATSATCVTGLVVFDTYVYWSVFGQIVILTLIQLLSLIHIYPPFLSLRSFCRKRKSAANGISLPESDGFVTFESPLSHLEMIQ